MKTLSELLEENYNLLVNEECKDRVIEYVKSNSSIIHEDIIFIKKLTKVASHIVILDQSSMDGFLERLYDFHMQGIEKIQKGDTGDCDEESIAVIKSHLHSHAGKLADIICDNLGRTKEGQLEKEMYWRKERYSNCMLSAVFVCEADPMHAAKSYSVAADSAKRIFDIITKKGEVLEEKLFWLKKWYGCKRKSAELSKDINFSYSALKYAQSGDAARIIFETICSRDDIPAEEKICWGNEWYENKLKAAEMLAQEDPSFSAFKYNDAAQARRALFSVTNDVIYLRDCYDMRVTSSNLAIKDNPHYSAEQDIFAGDVASELARRTGKEHWKKRAKRHYDRFLTYSRKAGKVKKSTVDDIKTKKANLSKMHSL